jgi:8-oxo-dGTP pyrophosphatase MutT (NUDIX family)
MQRMNDVPEYFYEQAAVIPYRRRGRRFEVLLITTRKGKWIIPKGIVEPELTARESAAREALEEAGVRGTVGRRMIGHFEYDKWGGVCRVAVYPLRVEIELAHYDEDDFRDREWLTVAEAAARVQLPDVDRMIRNLRQFVDGQSPAPP